MTSGGAMMLRWHADSWDSPPTVVKLSYDYMLYHNYLRLTVVYNLTVVLCNL